MAPHLSRSTAVGLLELTRRGLGEGSVALTGHGAALAPRAGALADRVEG